MARVRFMGQQGLNRLGVAQNTVRIRSLTGAAFRVPDILNPVKRIIGEVKNWSTQRILYFTRQLRDYAAYARLREGFRFDLWVNRGQRLSPDLLAAMGRGWVNLRYLPPFGSFWWSALGYGLGGALQNSQRNP